MQSEWAGSERSCIDTTRLLTRVPETNSSEMIDCLSLSALLGPITGDEM